MTYREALSTRGLRIPNLTVQLNFFLHWDEGIQIEYWSLLRNKALALAECERKGNTLSPGEACRENTQRLSKTSCLSFSTGRRFFGVLRISLRVKFAYTCIHFEHKKILPRLTGSIRPPKTWFHLIEMYLNWNTMVIGHKHLTVWLPREEPLQMSKSYSRITSTSPSIRLIKRHSSANAVNSRDCCRQRLQCQMQQKEVVRLPQQNVAMFTVITQIMDKCVVKILITRNLLDLHILPFLLIWYCCYYM